MKSFGASFGVLIAFHHRRAGAIFDPRAEIYSEITSGERAYLKAKEETTGSNGSNDFKASAMENNSLHQSMSTALKEIFHLANIHGMSPIDFNSTWIDLRELQRAQFMAEDGSLDAAYFLGLFYLYGLESLLPDDERAAEWFLQAAMGGHSMAQCALGLLLYHGHGKVKMEKSRAIDYFHLASENGNLYAHWLYARSFFEATSQLSSYESIEEQMDEAGRLFGLVANDIPEAAHHLAVMFEYGLINKEKDTNRTNFAKAAELYESAARRGYVESAYHLALMYAYGRGFSRDYVRAAELFRLAAAHKSQAHPPSMRYLAIIHANGFAHPHRLPDFDAALQLYEKCSSQSRFTDVQNLCKEEKEGLINLIHAARAGYIVNNVNSEKPASQTFTARQ